MEASVDTLVCQLEDEDPHVRWQTLVRLRKIAAVESAHFPVRNPRRFLHCVRRRILDDEAQNALEALRLVTDIMGVLGDDVDQILSSILPHLVSSLPKRYGVVDDDDDETAAAHVTLHEETFQVFRKYVVVSNDLKAVAELLMNMGLAHTSATVREASIVGIVRLLEERYARRTKDARANFKANRMDKMLFVALFQALVPALEDNNENVVVVVEEALGKLHLYWGDAIDDIMQFLSSEDCKTLRMHQEHINEFLEASCSEVVTQPTSSSTAALQISSPESPNGLDRSTTGSSMASSSSSSLHFGFVGGETLGALKTSTSNSNSISCVVQFMSDPQESSPQRSAQQWRIIMLAIRGALVRAGAASHARKSALFAASSSGSPSSAPPAHARMSTKKESSDAAHLLEWMRITPKKLDLASHTFETLALTVQDNNVLHLKLNRPKTLNAMNMQMWVELAQAFEHVEQDTTIKAVIVSGEGKAFTSGMDLNVFATLQKLASKETCEGRKREALMRTIDEFQRIISAPERCRVPVIAAIHGACIGAGVDFITGCDLRYCDASAVFSVKEVDLAIIADVGTLQRLPKLIGEQQAKELAYTGRDFGGLEAERLGLVLKTLKDPEELLAHVQDVAASIAQKSPLTVRGIKQTIHYQRDHSTADSLQQIRYHNAAVLYSDDLVQAIGALMSKSKPTFRDD